MYKSMQLLFLALITVASLVLGPVTPVYALTYPAEINKSFTPIAIVSGGVSRLRVTIYNPNANPLTNASWSDNLIGVQPGLSIANPPNVVHTCDGTVPGSATVTAVAGGTTISLSGGTVPRQIVNTPGSCYVEVNVTSTTPGNMINTLPASVLVATTLDGVTPVAITNTTPASATLNVIGVQAPSLSKGFVPSTISVGQKSTLTITLRNNDTKNPLTQTTLTDYLPANVVLATPVQHLAVPILSGCGTSATLLNGPGGTPAAPGDTALTLNNATIAKTSNCVITVDVTSLNQGSYPNTIPAGPAGLGSISTREGVTNASPANDTLNVQAFTLTKSFATSPIAAGGVSLMTITINNIASIPYTGVTLTDTFLAPAADNLEFLDDASKITTCVSGSEAITISRVAPAVNLDNRLVLTNGSIAANSSCTITVNVRAKLGTPAATYTNDIPSGAMSTTEGATNHAPASATLNVTSLSIGKAFSPTTFAAGQTSTLTITITNPSASPFTAATLADTLPTTLNNNLRYTGTPTTTCTTGSDGAAVALSGVPTTRTVTLTDGTIPANSTCTITATVTTDAIAPATAYTGNTHSNTIPAGALSTFEGGTNVALARAPVTVTTVTVGKTYLPTTVAYPNASRLRITITNPITGGALTGITLTDILDSRLEIVNTTSTPSSPNPVTTCKDPAVVTVPVLTALVGTQTISLSGGSLPAAPAATTSCTITVYVRPKVDTASSTGSGIPNTIGVGDLTTAGPGPTNSAAVTANLTVSAVSVSKAFQFSSFQAGTNNTLTITLTNSTGSNYTGANISDTLPTTPNTNLRFTGTPTTTCAGGAVFLSGAPTTRTVTMTGGTIPALGSCTITATVTTDVSAPNAAYTGANSNTIPIGALLTDQLVSNTTAATAPVTVYSAGAGMTAAKSFTPATINNGGNSDLLLTFTAPVDTALSGFSFTDTFPLGMTISNSSPATNTCGGTLTAATGTGVISLSGGNIAIGASCTIHVFVTSDTGSGAGVVYPNTINPIDINNTEARSIPVAVTSNLTVLTPSTLTMTKAFYPTIVNPNGLSTLRITLSNTNLAALVNVSLTDTTPGWPGTLTNGFVVAPIPNSNTTCGSGVITAVPGSRTISMANGVVPAQVDGVPGLCTIDVNVQGKSTNGAVAATYTNTIPAANVIGTIQGTGSTMNALAPATADITVRNITLEVVKGFVPQLVYGGTVSQMSITFRNPSAAAELTGISFTDNMFISGDPVPTKNYPAGEMIIATPPNFDPSDCGPAAVITGTPGGSTFSFSGGYLAPDTECTLTLDVSMTVNGNRTNRIPAFTVTSFNGASNPTPAEASLTNLAGASIDKSFSPILLPAGLGNYSLLTITIRTTALVALTNLGFVDNLPAGLEVSGGAAPAAVNNCGGTLSAAPGDTTIQLTGGTLNLGFSTCTMVIPISGALPGAYTNTIPTNTLTNNETISNVEPAIDTLTLTPYSLGNRVWYDTNNDGLLNNSEVGISGVRVNLYKDNGATPGVYDATDTFVGFQTTNSLGYYRFDELGADNYIVTIPSDNFRAVTGDTVAGDPLAGYLSSGSALAANGSVSDSFGPDPDSPASVDNDDNGVSAFVSNALDYVSTQAVTIGPGSTEPTDEADPLPNPGTGESVNNQSDRTVDFGFYRQQLSNQIFSDLDNDGVFTGADTPLAGAIVQLYASNGTTEIQVGPDGILGTADDTTGGVTTGAGGTYLFSGLPVGDYIVRVTPPSGYSAIDSGNAGDSANPNNNIDNNDNGLLQNPGQVSSAVVTLTPGVTGVSTTVNNSTATTLNPSLDFGFVPLYSLGNRVWFDTDNNSAINGAEVGINNVRVELYQDNGNGVYDAGDAFLAFDTTNASGYYRFDGLNPGNYVVLVPNSQFGTGSALDRYWSSGTNIADNGSVSDSTANDPDVDVDDSDDNGITNLTGNAINYVSSQAITLGPVLSEPINDNDSATNPEPGEAPNDQSNRTLDFGFYRVELSNQIFWDISADGVFGAGDVVLPDAAVRLYTGDGNTEILVGPDGILGTPDDAVGGVTSDPVDGTYLFSGLPAGNYIVRVTPPVGFESTVDSADTATPNSNIDNNDNGVGIVTGEVSSNQVALVPGVVSVSNIVTNSTGSTLNPSLDFGFVADSTFNFSLGNRVWFDTDNDGTMNGAEVGSVNVRVDLFVDNGATAGVYDVGDTFVDFKTTDSNGYYSFDDLAAGNYVVVILSNQFAAGGPLDGYWSSGTSIAGNGTVTDSIGPDVDTDPSDSDDNGVTTFAANVVNYVSSRAVTLGPTANEPVGETDKLPNPDAGEEPDNHSNRTVDFGFYQMQLSDLIFVDMNNNGLYNSGDLPLAGARVQLFASNGTTEINVGPDGILGTIDDAANGMVTPASGLYLFGGLPSGDYIVKVTPPAGYLSTVDANADTTIPNNNLNNNDNGIGVNAGQVTSNPVSLIAGVSGASTTVTNSIAVTHNASMDFGFNVTNGFLKTVLSTSEPATGGIDVTIGEIVTYRITMDLVAGTALSNMVITDSMDRGFAFVDCSSIDIAGTPVACSPIVSSITDSGDSAGNPANAGRQVVFNIGNIPAPDTDSTLVLEYRVIILDVIENQSGGGLNNSATVTWTGGTLSSSAPNVKVVEPDMAIDKSANPTSNVPLGTPIEFTLTINHTSPQSTADAFDVEVADILPPSLEYIPCSVTYSGWAPTNPTSPAYCPGTATTLTFNWDTFPRDQVAVIKFTARLTGTPATNSASIVWTSLDIDPGVGGLPQQLSLHNSKSTERWYDPNDTVNVYAVIDSVTINEPAASTGAGEASDKTKLPVVLPATGFAPNAVTILSEQPANKSYTATDIWLEIPSQGFKMPIVGVPLVNKDWDLTWLSQEVGWLEGTAFPGWQGNSALTGHVTLPNGKPGPFANLSSLKWGDSIIIHAYGQTYIYEVRESRTIKPYSTSVLKHEDDSWLTLITCKTYIESTNTYADRTVVRAVLVKVQSDPSVSSSVDRR